MMAESWEAKRKSSEVKGRRNTETHGKESSITLVSYFIIHDHEGVSLISFHYAFKNVFHFCFKKILTSNQFRNRFKPVL